MKRYVNGVRARIPAGPKGSVGRGALIGHPPPRPSRNLAAMVAAVADALRRREKGIRAACPTLQVLDDLLESHFGHGGKGEALLLELRTADEDQVRALEVLFKQVASRLLELDPSLCKAAPAFMTGHNGTFLTGCPFRYQATLAMLDAAGTTLVLDDDDETDSDSEPEVACAGDVKLPFRWWSRTVALAVLHARWRYASERTAPPGGAPML